MRDILDLSRDAQEQLLKGLTHHAFWKMRRLTWRGAYIRRGGSVPGGYEPYDFAIDAIAKALDGTRTWNRDQYKTLECFLRSIIDSDISHLVDSFDNSSCLRLATQSRKNETASAYEIPGREREPSMLVIDKEWQIRFHAAATKELAGEEFLIKLLECMEAEITKPEEIAVMLGTTVDNVNNEKKKIRRRLIKLDIRGKPGRKGANS